MARKYGKQNPRIEYAPRYAYTDGKDAAELVKAYGYALDPWQKAIINSWLGCDKSDRFTATSCGLSVPRQNGKNALLEVREGAMGIVPNSTRATTLEKFIKQTNFSCSTVWQASHGHF